MNPRNHTTTRTLAVIAGLALAAGSANAAVLINGDFETGDLTGWTGGGGTTGSVVSTTSPLAGTYSAVQTPKAAQQLYQAFTTITLTATTSFIFSASDPGGANDRSMNVTFRGSGYTGGSPQINLRLTDVGNNSTGDIQVFDGATWQTVLTSAVTFNTSTAFSLTINSYGVGSTYDLTVGSSTATGLSYFHGGVLANFAQLSFVNASNTAGSTLKIDNVSVIPEPSAAALLGGLGGLLLLRRRRN